MELRHKDLSPKEALKQRQDDIQRETGVVLDAISQTVIDPENVEGKNGENMIGAAQIPMGIAGPLKLQLPEGEQDAIYVPLATTEGTLIASVNRGLRASHQQGVTAVVEHVGATRAPVFTAKDVVHAASLRKWIHENTERIKDTMNAHDPFLTCESIDTWQLGRSIFVRFRCSTGDAMGMNMVTIAAQHVIDTLITPETGIQCTAVSGNMCADKKPSAISQLYGRGRTVHVETVLTKEVTAEILKTTPEQIVNVWTQKTMLGSIRAGSLGANAHAANILAALFIATGQDPAHVVDGASAMTVAEIDGEVLRFAVTIPALMVGVFGGGTHLPTQREALNLLGVRVPSTTRNEVDRFAAIVGATVLAGELSLHAALAASHLAKAHETFGQGKKTSTKEQQTRIAQERVAT